MVATRPLQEPLKKGMGLEEGAGVLREGERLVIDESSHWKTMPQGDQGKRCERFLFWRP